MKNPVNLSNLPVSEENQRKLYVVALALAMQLETRKASAAQLLADAWEYANRMWLPEPEPRKE